MAQRPLQHRLESESVDAFRSLLPKRLVYRELNPDYGIDGEVEEFDEEDVATGRRFFVQLKATQKANANARKVRLKTETRDYYRAQPLPVLMVRYVAETGQLYARWFHEFDGFREQESQSHIVFNWYPENELGRDDVATLVERAGLLLRLRAHGVDLPLGVAFEIPTAGAHGFARTELAVAFSTAARGCRGVLEEVTDTGGADLVATISDDEIHASLAGLASVTFHLGDGVYAPDATAESIAADVMSCIAGALARARQGGPTARLATGFLPQSLLSAIPTVAGEIGEEMMRAGRINEVLELADCLDADGAQSRETSGGVLLHLVMTKRDTLQPSELDQLEAHVRARFERRVARGRQAPAAASAENVGRLLMDRQRRGEAVDFFDRALELDPGRETADFAQLRAGALFLSDDYSAAVTAYDRAIALAEADEIPGLSARRADALMYAGRYRDALEAFAEIEPEHRNREAWVFLKMRALIAVLEETGIEEQDRDPATAHELASADELADVIQALGRIWELDAANHLAWFRHGQALYGAGGNSEAMHAFIVAAVMCEGDVQAWINVTILAAQVEDQGMLVAAALTGARLNSDTYMPQMANLAREMIDDPTEREQFLAGVKEAIELGKHSEASN